MFISPIIEVAIGLVLVYLILSMIVSSIGQVISQWLAIPANQLKSAVGNLLGNISRNVASSDAGDQNATPDLKPIVDSFYEAPSIKQCAKPGASHKPEKGLPSRIDASAFYPGLKHAPREAFGLTEDVSEILAAAKKVKGELSGEEDELLKAPGVQEFLASDLGASLSELYGKAKRDIDSGVTRVTDVTVRFEQHVADWYNTTTSELSNWYRLHMRKVNFVIAVFVTLAFNADSLMIAKSIWDSEDVSAAVSTITTNYVEKSAGPIEASTPEEAAEELGDQLRVLNQIYDSKSRTVLPLGILQSLIGWTATVFALSLGAPFWYDLLKRLIRIQGTVKETEKELVQPTPAPNSNAGAGTAT